MHVLKKIVIIVSLILPFVVSGASTGEVAERLMGPTEIVTRLMLVVCYAVGIALIVFALAQYNQHRKNPKLVPLTTPVLLVILGILSISIPYISTMSGVSFSAAEQAKRQGKTAPKSGAFSPNLPKVEKRRLPGPGRNAPDRPRYDEDYYDGSYDEDEGSHWTHDPRYD